MIIDIAFQTKVTPIVEGYGGWAFRMEIVPIESAYPGFGNIVVSMINDSGLKLPRIFSTHACVKLICFSYELEIRLRLI